MAIASDQPTQASEPSSMDRIKDALAREPALVIHLPTFRSGTTERRPGYFDSRRAGRAPEAAASLECGLAQRIPGHGDPAGVPHVAGVHKFRPAAGVGDEPGRRSLRERPYRGERLASDRPRSTGSRRSGSRARRLPRNTKRRDARGRASLIGALQHCSTAARHPYVLSLSGTQLLIARLMSFFDSRSRTARSTSAGSSASSAKRSPTS